METANEFSANADTGYVSQFQDDEVLYDIDLWFPEDHVNITYSDVVSGLVMEKLNYIEASLDVEKTQSKLALEEKDKTNKICCGATMLSALINVALVWGGCTSAPTLLGSVGVTALLYAISMKTFKNLRETREWAEGCDEQIKSAKTIRELCESLHGPQVR